MSARELKAELHQKIEALTDEQTVMVYAFLNTQLDEDNFDPNSPEVLEKIEKSLANAGQGKTYTTDEILSFINEWPTK